MIVLPIKDFYLMFKNLQKIRTGINQEHDIKRKNWVGFTVINTCDWMSRSIHFPFKKLEGVTEYSNIQDSRVMTFAIPLIFMCPLKRSRETILKFLPFC